MSLYLLIETRSTWESGEVTSFLETAVNLAQSGNQVDLFLIQNGVIMARTGNEPLIQKLQEQPGITIWVDEFSLSSRALAPEELVAKARLAGAETLVELLVRVGCKATWH